MPLLYTYIYICHTCLYTIRVVRRSMEERFRAKGIHISWMGGQGATIPRISQLYDRLHIVFCRIFVAFWMSLKKPCWLNQVIFISLQTQMHSREPVTAAQMNLKSTKELFVCRIACWSYSRWCCCACLFAFFWIAIFCLLTMGIQRQSYIILMEIGLNFIGILIGMWESIWQQWGSTNRLRHSANTSWTDCREVSDYAVSSLNKWLVLHLSHQKHNCWLVITGYLLVIIWRTPINQTAGFGIPKHSSA